MKKRVFILSAVIAVIDQLVKMLVVSNVAGNESIPVVKNFFYITYVENTGAAWGILAGTRWFLIFITFLAIYAIIKYFLLDVNITKIEFIGYSLLLGGIVGNLIDRVVYGYVVDFMAFLFGSYEFPVFNIADASIVIGTFLIIYHLMNNAIKQRRTK